MAITYRAWVPSITGKLSFTQIGKIGIPKALRAECSLYNDVWRFDCAEIRTKKLDDSIFQLRSREARKRHKNVVFALKANSKKVGDNYPFLKGELYCFIGTFTPSDVKNGKHWDVAPAFTVGFVLARSGKLTLTKMNIGKRLVHAVSQDTTKATNYLFKQSYFFLKDMVHRHRHHNPSDDTFIDCSIGKVGYGKHIAYQLAKRLIRRPIQNDPNSYQSALGILAYLKSYQQISSSTQEYSKANFEAIQQSLKAESVAVVNRMSNRKWIGAAGISVYTFILSKASFWDAGLCLIGGGDVGLKQSSSIVGLILLLFLTAHVSSILNWNSWRWFQEVMKLPSAFQASENWYKRSKTWLVFLLLASLLFIASVGLGVSWVTYVLLATIIAFIVCTIFAIVKIAKYPVRQ